MNGSAYKKAVAAPTRSSDEPDELIELRGVRSKAEMERAVNLFILAAAEWFQSAAAEGKQVVDAWGPETARPARRRVAAREVPAAPKTE